MTLSLLKIICSKVNKNKFKKELNIFTHLTYDEKILLYNLSKKLNDFSVCVEIGSYLGSSACFISAGLKKKSKLYCIDTWGNHAMRYDESDTDGEERDTYKEFVKNTNKYKSKIVKLRGWSYDVISELKSRETKIDLLFIDGDHNYDEVKKDWILYSELLKRNSLVAFHDVGWSEDVKRVIREYVVQKGVLINQLPNLEVYKIHG
jgi:predicted O-methyltransferase YrrM